MYVESIKYTMGRKLSDCVASLLKIQHYLKYTFCKMYLVHVLSLLLVFTYAQVHGTNYVIKVTTSPRLFSGTDARVYVNLFGVNGASTGSIRLHNSIWDFERGRTDTFHRSARFVGHLKGVKVYHDGWGIFPNWHLARITVSFNGSPLYTFYFNKWIPAWRWITAYEQNECRAGIALCEHVCIDTRSGYNCACHKGYKLDGRYKCQDVNECMTGQNKCEQQSTTCSNKPGSYTCQCKSGYQPDQSLYKCQGQSAQRKVLFSVLALIIVEKSFQMYLLLPLLLSFCML